MVRRSLTWSGLSHRRPALERGSTWSAAASPLPQLRAPMLLLDGALAPKDTERRPGPIAEFGAAMGLVPTPARPHAYPTAAPPLNCKNYDPSNGHDREDSHSCDPLSSLSHQCRNTDDCNVHTCGSRGTSPDGYGTGGGQHMICAYVVDGDSGQGFSGLEQSTKDKYPCAHHCLAATSPWTESGTQRHCLSATT